ncbi:MAG: aminotransferase class I/II-fold pyridoxal phosphate-dependent enzyme, partial [Muribaculaceae bacterium]|nr:aminotransferase class I/II-fold pyridoxal phosphate-dependent enzyme [Muribaculaceae bacterium]
DITVGTFGKAAASMGAFAIIGRDMHDYLVNTARSFIFSTAIPPMQAAWTRFTLGNLIRKDNRREHLARLGIQLQAVLSKYSDHPIEASHIQPLIVGNPQKAVELSRRLLSRYGIKALPIRKPTVPAGTERLRFILSSAMLQRDIEALDNALHDLM